MSDDAEPCDECGKMDSGISDLCGECAYEFMMSFMETEMS